MAEDELHRLVYSKPGHLIRRLHQLATAFFLEETADSGLTPVQYGALVAIRSTPDIDQLRVAQAIGFDRTTISGVVERLEAKGLIERRTGAVDRRTKQLQITKKGNALLESMLRGADRAQERTLECLTDDEKTKFVEMLAKIVNINNEMSRAPVSRSRSSES